MQHTLELPGLTNERPYRWVYYMDPLGVDADRLCMGFVLHLDPLSCAVRGYSMRADVVSLPADAITFWSKQPSASVISRENVLWAMPCTPLDRQKRPVRGSISNNLDLLPAELAFGHATSAPVPPLILEQSNALQAHVLQKASAAKRREERYHQSKARRDKSKARALAARSNSVSTPSPDRSVSRVTKQLRPRRPVPPQLEALMNAAADSDFVFPRLHSLSLSPSSRT